MHGREAQSIVQYGNCSVSEKDKGRRQEQAQYGTAKKSAGHTATKFEMLHRAIIAYEATKNPL